MTAHPLAVSMLAAQRCNLRSRLRFERDDPQTDEPRVLLLVSQFLFEANARAPIAFLEFPR
jgi:hypothetical protein